MPGAQERVLRRRIGSVRATKKITRAMELISASRVVRAQQRAAAARPYARQITGVIEDLAASGANVDHPLLRQSEQVGRVGYVVHHLRPGPGRGLQLLGHPGHRAGDRWPASSRARSTT